eukprot:1160821-Pelagomonas_calceolata.AAC.11
MQSQLKQRQCPARALRWSELEGHSRDGVQQHECDGPNRCSLAFVPLNIPKREESDATAVKHFLSSSQVDAFSTRLHLQIVSNSPAFYPIPFSKDHNLPMLFPKAGLLSAWSGGHSGGWRRMKRAWSARRLYEHSMTAVYGVSKKVLLGLSGMESVESKEYDVLCARSDMVGVEIQAYLLDGLLGHFAPYAAMERASLRDHVLIPVFQHFHSLLTEVIAADVERKRAKTSMPARAYQEVKSDAKMATDKLTKST